MKTRFLLPSRCKPIGLIIAIPAFILMVFNLHFGFTFKFLDYNRKTPDIFGSDNFTDELGGVLLIIGLLMAAFAREKQEDERISNLRLESLVWSVYVNSIFLIFAILFFYNEVFLDIMAYNICTPLILFVARFNLVMWIERKNLKKASL